MNIRLILSLILITALTASAGWWLARQHHDPGVHKHQLEPRHDTQGRLYYTCAMHPEVRQDGPGNCPICGMSLIERRETPAEREVLYWFDPMRPEVHFDAPGRSPFMDMDLVPKYADERATGEILIDPRMVQNLGMRTAPVTRGRFWQRVDTVGEVTLDERRIVSVETRTEGWVESLEVAAAGDAVSAGQALARIYSPALYTAARELELAREVGDAGLIQASRERLTLLGGDEDSGAQSVLRAPADGFVLELMARQGGRLAPGTPLMRIADLSRIWIEVQIPEAQAQWLRAGRPAEARLPGLPGQVFEGEVDYLYPQMNQATRSLRARLVFDNPDARLRPGMFADVSLYGGARLDQLLVPSEAVIRTGQRTVVMVAEEAGRYRPAHVVLGPERHGQSVILEGLSEGQQVVVSGQFLIDSEASLRGAYQRLQADPDSLDTQP